MAFGDTSSKQKDAQMLYHATRPLYEKRSFHKPFNMDINVGTWFTTTHIINRTPQDILVYPAKSKNNDPFNLVPSIFKDPSKIIITEPQIILRAVNHSGGYQNMFNTIRDMLEVEYLEVIVPYRNLLNDAIYIKELDLVISIEEHKDRLEIQYPRSRKHIEIIKEKAATSWYNQHTNCPLVIEANDPTGVISEIYAIINGITISTKVRHETAIPAFVDIRTFYRGHMQKIECDAKEIFDKMQMIKIDEDSVWFIGSAEFHLKNEYDKYIRERSCISQSDVDAKCKEVADLYEERIRILDQTIQNQKKEITQQKHIIEQHKIGVKATHEERKLAMEESLMERNAALEYKNKMLDQKIAELKVLKEHHSTVGSEVGMITNVIKGAVVVVPILIGLYIAASKSTAATVAAAGGIYTIISSTCSYIFDGVASVIAFFT